MANGRKKKAKNIKVLTLTVKDDKIEWKLSESQGGDASTEKDKGDEELRFDKEDLCRCFR